MTDHADAPRFDGDIEVGGTTHHIMTDEQIIRDGLTEIPMPEMIRSEWDEYTADALAALNRLVARVEQAEATLEAEKDERGEWRKLVEQAERERDEARASLRTVIKEDGIVVSRVTARCATLEAALRKITNLKGVYLQGSARWMLYRNHVRMISRAALAASQPAEETVGGNTSGTPGVGFGQRTDLDFTALQPAEEEGT